MVGHGVRGKYRSDSAFTVLHIERNGQVGLRVDCDRKRYARAAAPGAVVGLRSPKDIRSWSQRAGDEGLTAARAANRSQVPR